MDPNWATEHLQTIRTLMERSALYRRTLAPIMIVVGSIGVAGAILGRLLPVRSNQGFGLYWIAVGLVAYLAAFLLARRQALKAGEPLWSPPTRRVSQALAPAFCFGVAAGLTMVLFGDRLPPVTWLLAVVWIVSYGFALHAAGFFMQRGIKFFGWIFVLGGSGLLLGLMGPNPKEPAHWLMGSFFGLVHLAYGLYLYFTEQSRKPR
jgi:hypothetical protein